MTAAPHAAPHDGPTPYARAANLYRSLGWHGVLPLPHAAKHPVPVGWTGRAGTWPSTADIWAWTEDPHNANIALRLPPGVIGIDVDAYPGKPGAQTLHDLETAHGALPATWRTTSRTDPTSGIRLFTIPEGLRWPGQAGPGIEVIQWCHRYAVVWPSEHPEGGTYRWVDPTGTTTAGAAPRPDHLPNLPDTWVTHLTGGRLDDGTREPRPDVAPTEVRTWLNTLPGPHLCGYTATLTTRYTAALAAGDGASRHEAALAATYALTRGATHGHTGVLDALHAVHHAFTTALNGSRSTEEADGEWARMLTGACADLLATSPPTVDPCTDPFAGLIDRTTTPQPQAPVVVNPDDERDDDFLASLTTDHVTTEVIPVVDPLAAQRAQLLAVEVEKQRAVREARRLLDAEEAAHPERIHPDRLIDGATFILDAPDKVPTVWGTADEVAWAEGESLMLVGPPGVGKTTLAGQIIRARLGIGDGQVLGLPVTPTATRVLYLAMDRPSQAARALARLFRPTERARLAEALVVWKGPPPADIAKNPEILTELAHAAGADTCVIDSVKDAAVGLTEDDVAAGYNRARQAALTAGIELLELHHLVKRGAGGSKPTTLADVYGSAWLTAGAGSVLLLWGAAGDPIVEMHHLKQPAAEIGPHKVIHDHYAGTSELWHSTDVIAIARQAGPSGITAKVAAKAMFESDSPTAAQLEKARRKLESLTRQGLLEQISYGSRGRAAGSSAVWTAVAEVDLADLLDPSGGEL